MVKFLGNNIMKIMANITKHQIDSSGFGPTFLFKSEGPLLRVATIKSNCTGITTKKIRDFIKRRIDPPCRTKNKGDDDFSYSHHVSVAPR